MTTVKNKSTKKPLRFIEIYHDISINTKKVDRDSWNWRVVCRNKKENNILYSASGYNTKEITKRRAAAHNKTLKIELMIFDLSLTPSF